LPNISANQENTAALLNKFFGFTSLFSYSFQFAFVTQCTWILFCIKPCLFSKCFYVLFCREALERQTKEALKVHEEATKFPVESMRRFLSHEESLPSGNMPSMGKY